MAEIYFQQDSLSKALNGDGNYLGFLDVADQYGLTKAGNLASYYAGISYLRMGDFQSAIDFLKDFDGDDLVVEPLALGAIGDAYMELNETGKAIDYYFDAADASNNELTAPLFLMKAGRASEVEGDYRRALEAYKRIKAEFPRSFEGVQIDKYISLAEAKEGE